MSDAVAILIPRESVNDESATLLAWSVADGASVERGQCVAQIETSKATMDLEAPANGILRHAARVGQDVAIGAAIGQVVSASASAMPSPAPAAVPNHLPPPPSVRRIAAEHAIDLSRVSGSGRGGRVTKADVLNHVENHAAPPPTGPTRISPKAKELIRQLGLNEADFHGRGMVRARDVQPTPTPKPAPAPTPTPPVAASGIATRSEPLSRAKRTEANYLRSAYESTLASAVTVACPTRGFRAAAGADAAAIIVFETARLLRKYPAFNAYHDNGVVHYYDEVNVGFAVDLGGNLRVPILRQADRKSITAIADEMRDLVVACLDNSIRVESLAGGTFTITDLSGEGVTMFHPLINRGQSAILGVCAETANPPASGGLFNLILAFDHQLSEGRAAAAFIRELRDRLHHHESSLIRPNQVGTSEELRCSNCFRTHGELAALRNVLVQAVQKDGSPRLLCNLCLQGMF